MCRTDLHLAEGDLAPKASRTVPGHEVVGEVVGLGAGDTARFEVGDRVGVAWLRGTCGECRCCRTGAENLCPRSTYTGWDADGGYAEYAVVPAAYAYPIPDGPSDLEAAPLLCAGIIGYRALKRAALPPGGRLGIYGFGASRPPHRTDRHRAGRRRCTCSPDGQAARDLAIRARGRVSRRLARRPTGAARLRHPVRAGG